jgi:hypothetical protein
MPLLHPRDGEDVDDDDHDHNSKRHAGSSSSFNGAPKPSAYRVKVPNSPPKRDETAFLQSVPNVAPDESYGNDERQLNDFLIKHPMCSLEATSQKTLAVVSSVLKSNGFCHPKPLPVVGKSYDDKMLCPPNKTIGERECVCGDKCMAAFLARWRHGSNTDLAFVCKEYLLPDEHAAFLAGKGLPIRRKKCLLCSRYFTSFLYYKARVDPTFKLEEVGLEPLSFQNQVCTSLEPKERKRPNKEEEAKEEETKEEEQEAKEEEQQEQQEEDAFQRAMRETQNRPVENASLVSSQDGYRPGAMLFVDENFFSSRMTSREGPLASLAWQPVVKFQSNHYKYVKDAGGTAKILQIGIGSEPDPDFRTAPAAQ